MPTTLTPPEPHRSAADVPQVPPRTLGGTLRRIGPGLILAGAIVGSGELIATTKVGAEAGFWLLWLVILGCTLKVFAQVEMGRYTITWGRTSLDALDRLPGPRWRVNWLVWYWLLVVVLIISQNGGIVGGVGQALTIGQPLTEAGAHYNEVHEALVQARVELGLQLQRGASPGELAGLRGQIDALAVRAAAVPEPVDISLWAGLLAVLTAGFMAYGRYQFIQIVATVLVGAFTAVTVVTVVMLQGTDWAVQPADLLRGFQFRLPPSVEGIDPVATALAAFGMIGLSAGELIMYPYWCLEKGYARHTGPRDGTAAWAERAEGWMRVMRFDAWLSMAVYTFTTMAFYLLGAAVLAPSGLNPEGHGLIRTLGQMYVPVFGSWAESIFLVGAVTVLYSTYFVFAAGFARMLADALILTGLVPDTPAARQRWIRILGVSLPLIAFVTYLFVRAPVAMVLAAGIGQSAILPMLGGAALYFRYRQIDRRLRPGVLWDVFLWISSFGLLVAGAWSVYSLLT